MKYIIKEYWMKQLKKRLKMIGAIVIEGPKWCGKTTTAKQHAKSILQLQDPDNRQNYLKLAEILPSNYWKVKNQD